MKALVLDNHDSFTWNLVHALAMLDVEVEVFASDAISLNELCQRKPGLIVLSSGGGAPEQAGICLDVVRELAPHVPMLGVGLGHQVIAHAFGARIVAADEVMHGKISDIHHDGRGCYAGLPQPFEGARYHSLVVERASLPAELEETAWTLAEGGSADARADLMGLRHRQLPVEGLQFHPDSIFTPQGQLLLKNFLESLP